MKSFTSWLLIAILVGLLTKNVWSFPAHRAVDLSSDVLAEDTDAEDGDDDDTKSDDNKRVEIAKEGSGLDASKKTAVEQGKEEEEEEEDDSPDAESDNASGSGEVQKEDSAEEDSKDDNAETADGKTKQTRNEISKDDEADEEDSDNGEERAEEQSTGTIETDSDDDNAAKKDDIAEAEESEETDEDSNNGKRTDVARRDGCGCCGDDHGECCHHCHEHEGGCHEGCCCGHEAGHHHGHHEHEDCCHHHGHHHGFVHEWGQECCGEHHGHECCGHHEQGHHHEGEHEHDCCHHGGCCHHEEEGGDGGGGGGYGWGRSNVPVGYHCHDMVSKSGKEKTKRFCVPVYGLPDTARNTIDRPNVKKQTVHVGYGYASGDNYRLGYQQGGMGGLASSFTGQVEAGNPDGGANEHFNKRSLVKRNYDGHGYGSFNSGMMHGSATPYGHPVTHPGFTTMGFPGHALASQDVRHNVPHPMIKRQAYEEDSENLIQNQMRIDDDLPSVEQAQGMSIQYAPDEIEGTKIVD